MRTYIIILSEIPSVEKDHDFGEYVHENKFDFWRYTALNWILVTPDDVSTNQINMAVIKTYGAIFHCVLEININDVAGIIPGKLTLPNGRTPLQWFNDIKRPDFVPRWKREAKETK